MKGEYECESECVLESVVYEKTQKNQKRKNFVEILRSKARVDRENKTKLLRVEDNQPSPLPVKVLKLTTVANAKQNVERAEGQTVTLPDKNKQAPSVTNPTLDGQDKEGAKDQPVKLVNENNSEKPKLNENIWTMNPSNKEIKSQVKEKLAKNEFKNFTDLTNSPEAYMLNEAQVEVCESLDESSNHEVGGMEEKNNKSKKKGRRNWRNNDKVWKINEEAGGAITIEEMHDPGDNAWLLGREAESCMVFSCLLDSGNNSSNSVLSKSQYDKLCKMKGRSIKLLPYNKPIVAAGSTRLKIYGQIAEPLTIYFENFSTPVVIRNCIVISSKASHLNLSLRDISAMEVNISFSLKDGNYLKKGEESIRLGGKREVAQLVHSKQPEFLIAYLNEKQHQMKYASDTISVSELNDMSKVERTLKKADLGNKYLCKSRKGYSLCKPEELVVGENFTDPFVELDDQWISQGLETVKSEGIDNRYIANHTVKSVKKMSIESGVFTYVACSTKFPLGTEFLCEPARSSEVNISVMECVMRVSDFKKIVYIPTINLTSETIDINKGDNIAYVQQVTVNKILEEVKFAEKGEGDKHTSGPLSFHTKATSSYGPTLLKESDKAEENVRANQKVATFHPFFDGEEIDSAERKQRKDYCHRPSKLKNEEEDDGEVREKTKAILDKLEKEPKFNGTWMEGELKPLNYHIPVKRIMPLEKKRKLEEVADDEVRSLFETKFELNDNDYLNSLAEDVRKEMKKELLDILVKNKLAFSAGESDNDYEDEQGDCPWVEFQMELKPEFRETVFYEKPRPLSLSDTERLRQILVDWAGKGILRKNTPENASPHSLPVFLINKKDEGRKEGAPGRLIFDARRLGVAAVNRQIYLGSVSQSLALLEQNDLYCSLDIGGFFSSIRLSSVPAPGHKYSSQDYCSFNTTSLGSWTYLRCSQGLFSSVNLAAGIMQKVLEHIPISVAKAFSDDLLLSTKNEKKIINSDNWREASAGGKMCKVLDQVLCKIREGGLKLRLRKAKILKIKLRWLGFDISNTGVRVAWDIKKALLQESPSTSPKMLKQFLGKILFFKSHLPGYSCFTSRLHEATTRPPKNWKLSKLELEDWFALRRLFLNSTALGFPDYDNLEKQPLRMFIDFSAAGLSCLLTQFQPFMVDNKEEMKEVLLAVIAKKTNKALRNSSSYRGEASSLSLGLHHLGPMLRTHKWILFSDSLSLLYISGCKNVHNQLWRLYDQLTKQCFALIHLDSKSNFLSDHYSRLPDLENLNDDEQQLFKEYIEQLEVLDDKHLEMSVKKGSLLLATDKENDSIKTMQNKMLNYASRLSQDLTLTTKDVTIEGIFTGTTSGQGSLVSHVRSHCASQTSINIESLDCGVLCTHQTGWLPTAQNNNERVCVSRKDEVHCVEQLDDDDEDNYTKTTTEDDEDHGRQGTGSSHSRGNEKEGERLHRPPRLKIPGSLEHPLSPDDIRNLQLQDETLHHVHKYVKQGWPNMQQLRKQYFTPAIIRYFNLRTCLLLDDFEVLCKARLPHEDCRELRIVLPESLKSKIFKTIHFSHIIHRGLQSTLDAIKHRFFYLGMAGDLRARILTCGQCYVSRLRSPLANKYVPEKESILTKGLCSFNDLIFADTSGRLVTCNCGESHSSFAIFVDAATSFCVAAPLRSKRAENLKQAFKNSWVQYFNLPKMCQFDRGGEFYNKTLLSYLEANGTSYAFTPTASGRSNYSERKNLDIKRTARAVLSTMDSQAEWCSVLPEIICSLNSTICSSTGFSAQRLVYAHEAGAPLDKLVGRPHYEGQVEGEVRVQEPSTFGDFKAERARELANLADRECKYQLSETDKARARYLRFAALRENRLIALSRSAERYAGNSHPLFPLRESDVGKSVYFYKSRTPHGKSKSLTQKWVGPCSLVKILSPILAEIKTQYREICMNKRELFFSTAIDNLFPFPSSHNPVSDCDDPRIDLLESVIDNSLCDINLPDYFCEFPVPCPFQQVQFTNQDHVKYENIWKEICSLEKSLVLSDIFPPGQNGEKWSERSSRATITRYKQDTAEYEQARIKGQISSETRHQSGAVSQARNDNKSSPSRNDSDEYELDSGEEEDPGADEKEEEEEDVASGGGEESQICKSRVETRGGGKVEARGTIGGGEPRETSPVDCQRGRAGSHSRRFGKPYSLEVETSTQNLSVPGSSTSSVQPSLSRSCSPQPPTSPSSVTTDAEGSLGRRTSQSENIRPGKSERPKPRDQLPGELSRIGGIESNSSRAGDLGDSARSLWKPGHKNPNYETRVDWGKQAKLARQQSKQLDKSIKTVRGAAAPSRGKAEEKLRGLSATLPGLAGGATSFLTRLRKHPRLHSSPSKELPKEN